MKMTEELTVDVPVVAIGVSPAVEKLGGTLLHVMDSVKIRALPGDLPQTIPADISVLDTFEAVIHVGDLPLPEKVHLVTDPGELALRVQAPRVEEVAAPAPAVEGPAVEGPAAEAEAAAPEATEG